MNANGKPILVIGGGIAGMTTAVDAAEVGYNVILVEKQPYLGGRVVQMYRYFPKMCPPTCGFEINSRRIRNNPRIKVYTMANVTSVTGSRGEYKARIHVKPRYVTDEHAIDKSMAEELNTEIDDDFNYGMKKTKALYLPHDMAYPAKYVLNKDALSNADVDKLKEVTPAGAIDLNMEEEEIKVKVSAVVVATGWNPYDANKLDTLGFGKYPNVITNVMMERLCAKGGPTAGELVRPSDGQQAKNIAFVQCAGSRDENHLAYCSAVCCMGSLKQARYVREKNPDAKVTIFYIDIRSIGREENFYYDLLKDENITFLKGKVAKIMEDESNNNLTLDVQDTITRENLHANFDMVVLAAGLVPNGIDFDPPEDIVFDQYGFMSGAANGSGIIATGCAKRPCDVSRTTKDSTAAALKAIQCIVEGD